jgi:hypothetical protein
MSPRIDLVIARYKESLDWLEETLISLKDKYEVHVYIYNKGNTLVQVPDGFNIICKNLPNVGRESHTYLTHIVDNYDKLNNASYVVCLQGDFKEHNRWYDATSPTHLVQNIIQDAITTGTGSTSFAKTWVHEVGPSCSAHYGFRIGSHAGEVLDPRSPKCFGEWFNEFVNEWKDGEAWHTLPFWIGGLYAVSTSQILKRPVEYYTRLRDCVGVSLNPEVGHFMERAWLGVYGLIDPPKIEPAYIRKKGKLL